jgi:CDP-diacylglycerol---serine O-phosphatidyltransferase
MNELAERGEADGRDEGGPPGPRRPRLRRKKLTPEQREHKHRRIRRRGRRAYIRSVYSLPSLATLGNAICGFAAIYVSALDSNTPTADAWTHFFVQYHFLAAAYLIFIAMLFDALDGRLARFARHTTDFGGQLDSLADVVSFGVAPAILGLQVFHDFTAEYFHSQLPPIFTRTVWAIAALYVSCAAIRLARFNVSNEHGEQHHFSFLGLPSPGAAAVVAGWILVQQDLLNHGALYHVSAILVLLIPLIMLPAGLLMVSVIRYPHLVNRYLRGRRSIASLLVALVVVLLLVIVHRYTIGFGTLLYMLWGPMGWATARMRRKTAGVPTPSAS